MGLMDMFGKKSPLVDCNTYLSNIAGKLTGIPGVGPEGDFSARLVPDDKQYLLNRNKVANASGHIDLKVKLDPAGRQAFSQAVQSMQGKPLFVSGVLVNDDSQGGRAEIHPLDMIYSPLDPDQYPSWFKAIQGNLKDPNAVLVYRVVAATDASKSNKPPKSEESRAMNAVFPYPPKPNFPKIKIDFEVRASLNLKADFRLNNNTMKQRVELDLGLETIQENGPGVFVGELVVSWGNE
jgi:hypothetical protein